MLLIIKLTVDQGWNNNNNGDLLITRDSYMN